jgi:H+/Cl- antiporter ClcA
VGQASGEPAADDGGLRRGAAGGISATFNAPITARTAVLGVVLGLLPLALPRMYGVGYPVMFKATDGGYAIWFLIVLAFGKILATSLSIGIGDSGGIFAPSLFIGVTSGMAWRARRRARHARAPPRSAARLLRRRDHHHRELTSGRAETGRRRAPR